MVPTYRSIPGVALLAILAVSASPGWAQSGGQPSDFLAISDFPDARAVVREYHPDDYYTIALSTFKKIGGNWTTEREQRLSGDVSRRTLELSESFSAREAYQFYREQLSEYAPRELFACEKRECGGSINWANNHFEVIQLYGLDQHQYYSVYELTDGDSVYYASLYTVRRGNRRVYVQLDLVRTTGEGPLELDLNPATFQRQLSEYGYFVLPGFAVTGSSEEWSVQMSDRALDTLAAVLRQESEWRVALVGHDYAAGSLESQRQQSSDYARQVREALKERKVDVDRLDVYGLGSLSPAGRGERSARVEVVRLPQR